MSGKFDNIEYLKQGSTRQKQAYAVLKEYEVLSKLKDFSPILVGTIPINIAIENSDLDIICHWKDKMVFVNTLKTLFGKYSNFNIREDLSDNRRSVC